MHEAIREEPDGFFKVKFDIIEFYENCPAHLISVESG
jgi:hypothetical protein